MGEEAIAGITLRQYADLSAAVSHTQDRQEQVRIVEGMGVPAAQWDAAVQGWTARMQELSDMGRTATAFMPLYQEALARRQATASVGFEEWVAIEAAIAVFGVQGALAHYGIDQGTWTTIAGRWTAELAREPMRYGPARNDLHAAEVARLRSGGAPRPVSVQRSAPVGGPPAPAPTPAPPRGPSPGEPVLVLWSDGNRYRATYVQSHGEHALVAFADGRQEWVPSHAVSGA